jgi:hypothetical protein
VASLLPAVRYETLGELLGMLTGMLLINIHLPLSAVNDPRKPLALVAGGFFLVKRTVYHELGGHAAVRGQVVEDVALGTRAKALGKRVFTALTHDLYTARMYEGWRDTFHGLKKNAYAGASYNPLMAMLVAPALLLLGALPPVYAVVGVWAALADPRPLTWWLAAIGVLAFACELLVGMRTARDVGMRRRVAWLLPLGFGFFTVIFAASVLDHYRRGNTWAGRRITRAQRLAHAARVD